MTTRIIIGDARARLAELPSESVHCVVTSPPYWGLRDYGTAQWDGGDEACDHTAVRRNHNGEKQSTSAGSSRDRIVCADCDCGAKRIDSQIGLEPDYREYVAALVGVFREVRRVLRADGTVWLNLGDSYNAGREGGHPGGVKQASLARHAGIARSGANATGLKPKDLCGIPWRVAFALQDDGWYLRQDIIWSKPNPMPESVTDRCTKAHEYLFLPSKSERYYYDAAAIADEAIGPAGGNTKPNKSFEHDPIKHRTKAGLYLSQQKSRDAGGFQTRNKRSVWTVATAPYSEAHFATFPPALSEPCILAGCPRNGTVLDPFFGAGTTALVADRLGRNCIGIELNPAYAAMAQRRIDDDAGMFAETWCEAAQ